MNQQLRRLRNKIHAGVRQVSRVIGPTAKVVASATQVIATIQKPTVIGVVNAVTNGVSTLNDVMNDVDVPPSYGHVSFVDQGSFLRSARELGGSVVMHGPKAHVHIEDMIIEVNANGGVFMVDEPSPKQEEVLRRIVDRALPKYLRVTVDKDNHIVVAPLALTDIASAQATAILARTRALMSDGSSRVILLEGRPGIGKTTAAQAIAREANLGRIVMFEPDALYMMRGWTIELYKSLSAGVVIVDDIDKIVSFPLATVEKLRETARLVVFTANNGAYDNVLDGALMRPARIDEVFTIEAPHPFQREPFNKLDAAQWAEVSEWPIAYLNELERRLRFTPNDLRIKDLRERMARRTRSGAFLGTPTAAPQDDLDSLIGQVNQ